MILHDYYWCSESEEALLAALAMLTDFVGPVAHEGNFYALVRSRAPLEVPAECALADAETGRAVCGIWT